MNVFKLSLKVKVPWSRHKGQTTKYKQHKAVKLGYEQRWDYEWKLKQNEIQIQNYGRFGTETAI